jgi:hypothetical protein
MIATASRRVTRRFRHALARQSPVGSVDFD